MPGFGQGAFGSEPFGQWPWSQQVLYDLLPSLYKQADADNGNVLQTWTDSLRYSFDLMNSLIAAWSTLRDPLQVRTKYDEVTTVVLGPNVTPPAPIEQRGVDGSVDSLHRFNSPTLRVKQTDLGKKITLLNSNIPINNRTFVIASVLTATRITCDPPLIVDPGPIRWQLEGFSPLPDGVMAFEVHGGDVSAVAPGWILFDGFSEFQVYERLQFFPVSGQTTTLTVRDGSSGTVISDGRFEAEVGFAQTNVGQPFSVSGSTVTVPNNDFTNNGKYQIYAVDPTNPRLLTFHQPLTIETFFVSGAPNPDSAVTYTLTNGSAGVQVAHVAVGPSVTLFVQVVSPQITVHLGTDSLGNVTSTAAEVVAAVNALPAAAALVTATLASGSLGGALAAVVPFQAIPGARLLPDSGPLSWSLLPFPQLQLFASANPAGTTTQGGIDLVLLGSVATATTARFSQADVGNIIVVLGSVLGNNQVYTITSFINVTQVGISPSAAFAGTTATIASFSNPLVTLTGLSGMSPSLVGQYITLSNCSTAANNGTFQIITYISPTSVAVENPSGSAPDTNNGSIVWGVVDTGTLAWPATNLTWSEHIRSGVGDGTQAALNAPSLLDFLAQDFGIVVDDQESEARQRSWVANVSQWIGFKGTKKGYEIIANISGFDIEVFPLFRVSQPISIGLPSLNIYVVGTSVAGRFGTDGTLKFVGGALTFVASSAVFVPSDVGNEMELTHCVTSSNNGIYTIETYVSPTEVQFAPFNTAVNLPDFGIGGTALSPAVVWSVVALYTTQAPTRPLFDEINTELMETIVNDGMITPPAINHFALDAYCSDPNFINHFDVDIVSATPTSSSGVPIFFTVVAQGIHLSGPLYTSMGVVLGVGKWKLTDSAGNPFYVETVPSLVTAGPPPVHTFQVFSSAVPQTGTATLEYDCALQLSCDYCQASKVLVIITEGTIASESGPAIERVLERVLFRLESEVTPAHVQLIPILSRTLQATLNLTATITADIQVVAVLLAPEQAYFDMLPGDAFSPDPPPLMAGGGAASVSAFATPTATITGLAGLTSAVVGSALFLNSAASSGNNGRFIITGFVSSTSVQIRNPSAVAGDANNGTIEWLIETPGLFATIITP